MEDRFLTVEETACHLEKLLRSAPHISDFLNVIYTADREHHLHVRFITAFERGDNINPRALSTIALDEWERVYGSTYARVYETMRRVAHNMNILEWCHMLSASELILVTAQIEYDVRWYYTFSMPPLEQLIRSKDEAIAMAAELVRAVLLRKKRFGV